VYRADDLHLRTFDPKLIALAKSRKTFEQAHTEPYWDEILITWSSSRMP
jgi:hypothetical protein